MICVRGLILCVIVAFISFVNMSSYPELDLGLILLTMSMLSCGATYWMKMRLRSGWVMRNIYLMEAR